MEGTSTHHWWKVNFASAPWLTRPSPLSRISQEKTWAQWHQPNELPQILQWTRREYEECVQIEPTSEGSHHLESRTETWDHPAQPNMLLLSKGRSRSPKEHTDGMLGDVANKLPNGSRHYFGRHRFSLRVCDSKTFTEVFICVSALIPQDCRLRQHHQEVKWIPRDSQVS